MIVVTLARKPLSASSVAANVLEHGTGALHIEDCRVGPAGGESSGRWPSNLILQHRDRCEQVGFRQVKSDGHYPKARSRGSQVSGPSGHTGQDNLVERHTDGEEVSAWECEPGCLVAELDAQSGVSLSPTTYTRGAPGVNNAVYGEGVGQQTGAVSLNYGDKGGASRFFKQVGGVLPDGDQT